MHGTVVQYFDSWLPIEFVHGTPLERRDMATAGTYVELEQAGRENWER